jgi:alkaline phosphatase
MATGFKTWDKYISMTPPRVLMPGLAPQPEGMEDVPALTILEAARLKGKSVGIVSTSEIQHATPAAFSSHAINRADYDDISEQQVHNGLTVAFGGGWKFLMKENRKDGEDLIPLLEKSGTRFVTNLADFRSVSGTGPLWALFAPASLSMDIDRDPAREPGLDEMTRKAISILSKNTNGFVLMVEGSQIDWAAHANDPVGIVSEALAFDRAVAEALAFARNDGSTAVIVAPDHGNSGLSIGSKDVASYSSETLGRFIDPIRNARATAGRVRWEISSNRSNLKDVLRNRWQITNLSPEEETALLTAKDNDLQGALSAMLSKRAGIGFTTWGHTGEEVVLGFYSPENDGLHGVIENTDIPRYADTALGLGLEQSRGTLYIEARGAFPDAIVATDDADPRNPVLIVKQGSMERRYPLNRNYCLENGKPRKLKTPTVRSKDRWFLSPPE